MFLHHFNYEIDHADLNKTHVHSFIQFLLKQVIHLIKIQLVYIYISKCIYYQMCYYHLFMHFPVFL